MSITSDHLSVDFRDSNGSFQFEKKKSPGRPFLTVNAANVQRVRLLMPQRESINAEYIIQIYNTLKTQARGLRI